MSTQGGIRLIDGRRMQCKDIPDEVFMTAVHRTVGTPSQNWRMRWEIHAAIEEALGWIPEKLLLAKAHKLIAAGKMGGCDCGCRGDWHPADECVGGETCCGKSSGDDLLLPLQQHDLPSHQA